MTDPKRPHVNSGNERTVHNPDAPGMVERVDPATGETTGTIDTSDADKH